MVLRHSLDRTFDFTNHVIITGNINTDMLGNSYNDLTSILFEYNLENIIKIPTRITETSQKFLDPFLINDSIKINLPSDFKK